METVFCSFVKRSDAIDWPEEDLDVKMSSKVGHVVRIGSKYKISQLLWLHFIGAFPFPSLAHL